MTLSLSLYDSVLAFWTQAGPGRWFARDDAFDAEVRRRFEGLHLEAAAGGLRDWLEAPRPALAYLLLTDQIPRNIYRGTAHAFATDPLALSAARLSVLRGHPAAVEGSVAQFFYLPFEHAEDLAAQEEGVRLMEAYAATGAERSAETLRFARLHRDVIARFGRFPHRNPLFGRETTAEEQAYLDGGGFRG